MNFVDHWCVFLEKQKFEKNFQKNQTILSFLLYGSKRFMSLQSFDDHHISPGAFSKKFRMNVVKLDIQILVFFYQDRAFKRLLKDLLHAIGSDGNTANIRNRKIGTRTLNMGKMINDGIS